jgi:hypothetical protein
MSARDRAFSNEDRESLQLAIEANNEWATKWVKNREQKLVYLEGSIDPKLIAEANEALSSVALKLNFDTQPEFVRALWDLSDTLSIWRRMLEQPRNVEKAAEVISQELNLALNSLASAGVWTRRNAK